jgi:hypothetical protein
VQPPSVIEQPVAHAFKRQKMTSWRLRRTFDASGFNAVANHCDVKPWLLAPDGEIDLSLVICNPSNYALWCDGGGFILVRHEAGIYEVHSLFEPEARGHSIAAMRAGFEYMFERTDADEILTKVPDGNRAALAFAKKAGFREVFRSAGTAHYSLTLIDWAVSRPDLEEDGEWFHEQLESKKLEVGSTAPIHDDCAAHNRMVGAAVRMVKAGNAAKAVGHYNKWARMAGYAALNLVSANPPTIDVIDGIVELSGENMEIILCR